MKKWTILTIAVLAAILLVMQYLIEKKKVAMSESGQQAGSAEQQLGVALPESATTYTGAAVDNYVPDYVGGAQYGTITMPTIQSTYKGACEASSLQDMLASHDKYWGFLARDAAFNQNETQKMYDYLADYTACQAAARTDASLCDSLPSDVQIDGKKVDVRITPNYRCRTKTVSLFFEAYRAGNISGDSYCRLGVGTFDKQDLERFSVPEFCSVLPKGQEAIEGFLLKAFAVDSPEAKARVRGAFPVKEGDCAKDKECLTKYELYNAVKKARPDACPNDYVQQCRALAERSAVPCEKTLQEMSKFYCAAVARVKKASGGYIGLSKEEAKVELDKLKAQRAEADEIKKQQQKIMEEVNKQVRETLKKK
ncbi:MAG: hypothetical protein A2049_06860 [Elusimicrobia bacterium GWA2_62_23]|nr:MAG: hypothetical protein A2049_06860 [Elusimicrobia bacterium GWA2_62_23]OGR70080.1 MAG: hypothetical protein A2179_00075 [Elusimicrobia bacterium GWC2_63_65]